MCSNHMEWQHQKQIRCGRGIIAASMMKRGEIPKTSTEYKKEIHEKDTLSHYQKSYLILVTDTVN